METLEMNRTKGNRRSDKYFFLLLHFLHAPEMNELTENCRRKKKAWVVL